MLEYIDGKLSEWKYRSLGLKTVNYVDYQSLRLLIRRKLLLFEDDFSFIDDKGTYCVSLSARWYAPNKKITFTS